MELPIITALRRAFEHGWFSARQAWPCGALKADLEALARAGLLDASRPSTGPAHYRVRR